jgi:transcriptional regulator with PAS, ATPase and Fis domain
LETQRIRDTQAARKLQQARTGADPFLGNSPVIPQLADAAKRVAASDAVVLIQGETGVGKGVLARWIHENSNRSEEALVDLNCAGFTREFLETELFGYEKGAYTGAGNAKQGLLEVAHRGTVLLDEIGDMDLQIQPKLLKVLEEKMLRRLGELRDRRVDIRLIAATHQDLAKLSRENRFRSDLYFRISAIPLRVPSLRERPQDIEILANHLLRMCSMEMGRTVELTPAALDALRAYPWPGNIRELKNVIERAVLLSDASALAANDLQFEQSVDEGQPSAVMQLVDLERSHIKKVLSATRGNVVRAAKLLGVPRSSLYRKVKEFNIALPE